MPVPNLDLIWRCCDLANPVLTESDLTSVKAEAREFLAQIGFIKPGMTSRFAACPDCGHVNEFAVSESVAGEKVFLLACPEHGRVVVDGADAKRTTISFRLFSGICG